MKEGSIIQSRRHWSLKEKARKLRVKGMSYREIRQQITAAKSSLSLWCRDVPLTVIQWQKLRSRKGTLKGI